MEIAALEALHSRRVEGQAAVRGVSIFMFQQASAPCRVRC